MDASWLSLVLAAGLTGFAALTWAHPPTPPAWKLAILAGEYGHFLAWLSGLLVSLVLAQGGALGWNRFAVLVLLGVAAGLLLWPTVQAWRFSRELPDRLRAVWGVGAVPSRPALSLGRLFVPRLTRRLPVETREVPRVDGAGGLPLRSGAAGRS